MSVQMIFFLFIILGLIPAEEDSGCSHENVLMISKYDGSCKRFVDFLFPERNYSSFAFPVEV